jgi:outer membrane protein assembly factor BamB
MEEALRAFPDRYSRYYSEVTSLLSRRSCVLCLVFLLLRVAPADAQRPPSTPATFGVERTSEIRQALKRNRFPFPVELTWEATLDAPPSAPAGYDETQMYVPLRSERGHLVALSLVTGEIRWTAETSTTIAPVACAGQVLVVTDGGVEARDAASGEPKWTLNFSDKITVPPVCDTETAFVSTATGHITAVQPIEGIGLWRQSLGAPIRSAPALSRDRIFAALDDKRLVSIDRRNGAKLWERSLPALSTGVWAALDRVCLGSVDNYLYCFGATNGEVAFQFQTGADLVGAPAGDEELLYFVSLDNVLRAVFRRSGNLKWKQPLPARPTIGPVTLGDAVMVAGLAPGGTAVLRAFGAVDGTAVGEFGVRSRLVGHPHLATRVAPLGRLIVVAADGSIIAVTSMIDAGLEPLSALPGTAVAAEQFPTEPDVQPLGAPPGVRLPIEEGQP